MSGDIFALASGLSVHFWLGLTLVLCSNWLGGEEHPFGHLADYGHWKDKSSSVGSSGRNNPAELILGFR